MHRYLSQNSEIEGQRLACGRYSINEFFRILSLEGTGYEISSMGWIGNRVVLNIILSGLKKQNQIALYIAKRMDTQPALLKTTYLDIYYSSSESDERFAKHILSLDLNKYTFDDLLTIIKQDPELGAPSSKLPQSENLDRPENHLDSWGGRDLYANFFAEGEFARAQLDSVNIYENCVFIQHSDVECVSIKPNLDLRLIKYLVKYPWFSSNREKYKKINRVELPDVNKFFSTDLRENDIIMGHSKVKDVLDYVLSNVKKKNIFISNTCTPVVIGEDVESIVSKAKKRRKDLLYLTVTPQSMEVVLKDLFKIPAKSNSRLSRNAINLIGFERDLYLLRLIRMLKRLGIEVNSVVIPDISPGSLRLYKRGGVDILKPNSIWNHLYFQLNSASSHKYFAIDAPYGFDGTIRWIREIGRVIKKKITEKDIFGLFDPQIIKKKNLLTDKMKSIGVIFIIRKDEGAYLTDSARTWGIPLLNFFKEMGSRIEILIRAKDVEEARGASEQILKLLNGYHNYEIRFFRSFDEMMTLVEKSVCQIVFSNHSYDWRITSCGKFPFSLNDFEVGFDGSLYTMNKIYEISQNRFFPAYFRFLKRDYTGQYEEETK